MYILTMQHQSILNQEEDVLLHNGTYNHPHAQLCYDRMEQDYRENKDAHAGRLFWGFLKLGGLPVDFSEKSIERFLNIQSFGTRKDHVLLLVDVPAEELWVSSYYDFSGHIAKCEALEFKEKYRYTEEEVERIQQLVMEHPCVLDEMPSGKPLVDDWDSIYQLGGNDELQVVFPTIRKSQIVAKLFVNPTEETK